MCSHPQIPANLARGAAERMAACGRASGLRNRPVSPPAVRVEPHTARLIDDAMRSTWGSEARRAQRRAPDGLGELLSLARFCAVLVPRPLAMVEVAEAYRFAQ